MPEDSESARASSNTLIGNTASSNQNGFYLNNYAFSNRTTDNILSGNSAEDNTSYGYYDLSSGSGTGGTANLYTGDECSGNGVGGSYPSGLGSPQS